MNNIDNFRLKELIRTLKILKNDVANSALENTIYGASTEADCNIVSEYEAVKQTVSKLFKNRHIKKRIDLKLKEAIQWLKEVKKDVEIAAENNPQGLPLQLLDYALACEYVGAQERVVKLLRQRREVRV